MNDLKEIGGFIVSADPYVNHDTSLSGNGTLTSPLGVNDNNWHEVTSAVSYNSNLINAGSWKIYYNPFLKEVNLVGDLQYKASTGYVMTWPSYLQPAASSFLIGMGQQTYVDSTGLKHAVASAIWAGGSFVWGVQ